MPPVWGCFWWHSDKAESTLTKTIWLLRLAKADFGKMPIGEITPPVVLKCLRRVEAKGNHETAKRLRATIGGMFRYAIVNGAAENELTVAPIDYRSSKLPHAIVRGNLWSAIFEVEKIGCIPTIAP
jgi:integrase